jgi:hypothetical protein
MAINLRHILFTRKHFPFCSADRAFAPGTEEGREKGVQSPEVKKICPVKLLNLLSVAR